ncbi:MAG: TRAP transporter substrate-binding protein [Betaproteobacteria bacterium]
MRVAVVLALALAAAAAQATELKLAHFMSPQHPMHAAVMAPFAQQVEKASGGALKVRIYPAGELGKGPDQQFKRVVERVADITFGIQGYTATLFPRTMVAALPGAAPSSEAATRKLWAILDPHLAPEYSRVKVLGMWTNDLAVLISRGKPLRSLADLKGLKVRAPDAIGSQTLEAWGAVPVNIDVTKVYTSFQSGVFDAILIGASAIRSFKLEEVGEHYTIGLPSVLAPQYLLMNRAAWDALSAREKAVLEEAAGLPLSLKAAKTYQAAGDRGIDMVRKAGRQVIELSPQAAAELRKAAQRVHDEYLAEAARDGVDLKAVLAAFESAK